MRRLNFNFKVESRKSGVGSNLPLIFTLSSVLFLRNFQVTSGSDDEGEAGSAGSHFWELVSSSRTGTGRPFQSSSSSLDAVEERLGKLEHHFTTLKIHELDCRFRLLCTLAQSPKTFAPLSHAFLDETSYQGDEKLLQAALLGSASGAKLLAYIDAVKRGSAGTGCIEWTFRCPQPVTSLIDYKALLVWREVEKWLTVKMVAKKG